MGIYEYVGDDGQTMLLPCSALALPAAKETDLSPFKLGEWNELGRKIRGSAMKAPAALRGRNAAELGKALALPTAEAERIARLLEFSTQLSVELQSLFEHGLWR